MINPEALPADVELEARIRQLAHLENHALTPGEAEMHHSEWLRLVDQKIQCSDHAQALSEESPVWCAASDGMSPERLS